MSKACLPAAAEDAENDTLTIHLLSQPTHGQFQLYANGGFIYTPNPWLRRHRVV